MCTHLSKRGSTYYFRRVVPDHVRPWFDGRAEWVKSMGTKDPAEGKRRVQAETVRTNGLIEAVERRIAAGEHPAGSVTTKHPPGAPHMAMSEQEIARLDAEGWEAAAQDERRMDREPERQDLEQRFKRRSSAQLTRREAAFRDILRDRDYALGLANDRAAYANARHAEALAVTPDAIVDVAPAEPAPKPPALEGMMLDKQVVDQWAKERNTRPKGVDTYRAVARWFYERTSRKPVGEITRPDVIAFKNKLIDEGQTPANIAMKLSRLRTLLQWSFENDHATSNVGSGVTMRDSSAGRNRRVEFDLASLRAIFGSPVFTEGLRPSQGRGECAYWLPLLALFTGARMEELGQLRPSDVTERSYPDSEGRDCSAWIIRITEDGEEGLILKNAGSERIVPVHPQLVRLGFVDFVKAAAKAGRSHLFHELTPNIYGRRTAKWGEWFGRYKRTDCGITDRRMVFHSFRHTFKHYGRHANIIEGVQRQLMGHTSGDVADAYGSGYTVHQLVEGMKLFQVPGLILENPKTP